MNSISVKDIESIVAQVLSQCGKEAAAGEACVGRIPGEVSARHVHLDKAALEQLFGSDYALTPQRELSQPGQFLSKERVKLVTEKGEFSNVAVLGPLREQPQVELSFTDARSLGISAPLRLSGDLRDAGDVIIVGPKGVFHAKGSVIVAKAHIHMTEKEARQFSLADGERVSVLLEGERPVTIDDVIVRVSSSAGLAMHMDYDEANAAMFSGGSVLIRKRCARSGQYGPPVSCEPAAPLPEQGTACKGKKQLITEEDARKLVAQGQLSAPAGVLLTPSARDVFSAAAGLSPRLK